MNPAQAVDQTLLNTIVANELRLPDGKLAVALLPGLMFNLGATDPDLRENSLDILWTWISQAFFTDEELRLIAQQMAANLTIGLGEKESDTVFLRAFSTLILASTLEVDMDRRDKGLVLLFNEDQIHSMLGIALNLLRKEKDLRGYVELKGWAHCAAHTGDLLGDFAIHPSLVKDDLEEILNTLQVRITSPAAQVFIHNEDERLAAVVLNILQRELVTEDFFKAWLDRFVSTPGRMDWKEAFTHSTWNCARVNTKSFLRGIYFFLLYGYKDQPAQHKVEMAEHLKPLLLNCLKQIYPNSRYADGF